MYNFPAQYTYEDDSDLHLSETYTFNQEESISNQIE